MEANEKVLSSDSEELEDPEARLYQLRGSTKCDIRKQIRQLNASAHSKYEGIPHDLI